MKKNINIIKRKEFKDCIIPIKYTNKILTKNFLKSGKYPIISQEENFINGYWNNEKDLFVIKKPVIIFGDHTKIIKYIDFNFVIGADGIKILEPIDQLNSKFFYYQLKNIKLKNLGYARHYKLLKEANIIIPPLQEQERIVNLLDASFEKLEKLKLNTEKNLLNAKELFETILNKLFTENTENLEEKTLGEVCEIYTGNSINEREKKEKYTNLSEGFNYIATKDINNDNTINYENGIKIPYNKNFKIALPGASLLCIEGGSSGKKIAITKEKICFGNKLSVFKRKNEDILNDYYIFYYLQTNIFKKYFYNILVGLIGGVSVNKLKNIPIILPPLQEQERIVKILDDLQGEIKKLERLYDKKLELIKELKESILDNVFNGDL